MDDAKLNVMLKDLLATIWRRAPKSVRRWTMRLSHPRFGATAAGVITDKQGRVLLLEHRFRAGSGWGLPGGFLQAGEQPEAALRRELNEEVGLKIDDLELFIVRVFRRPKQLEIAFVATTSGNAKPQSMEINRLGWFAIDELPTGLPEDQIGLIRHALGGQD
jgi:mutator protein MutT